MEEKQHLQAQLGIVVGLLFIHILWPQPVIQYLAAGLGLFFILFPSWAKYVSRAWWKLGTLLGRVNGAILLSLLFFLVLTPLALLRKFLRRKKPDRMDSYYVIRDQRYTADDLKNPF